MVSGPAWCRRSAGAFVQRIPAVAARAAEETVSAALGPGLIVHRGATALIEPALPALGDIHRVIVGARGRDVWRYGAIGRRGHNAVAADRTGPAPAVCPRGDAVAPRRSGDQIDAADFRLAEGVRDGDRQHCASRQILIYVPHAASAARRMDIQRRAVGAFSPVADSRNAIPPRVWDDD